MKFVSNIPTLEIGGYFVIWIGAVLYSSLKVKNASGELLNGDNFHDTITGWKILNGRPKDTTDYEWEIIIYIFYHQFSWICLHLIVSELLRWQNYMKLLPHVQIFITVLYLIANFNISVLVIVLLQPFLFETLIKFKRKRVIWLCEIFLLVLLHGYKFCFHHRCIPYLNAYISHIEHTTIILTLYWTNLRCVSYAVTKIDNNTFKSDTLNLLSYSLYLPLFSAGPFIDIGDFLKNQCTSKTSFYKRVVKCCLNLIRFVFWMIVTDFLLHYVYVSNISYYPSFVEKFDDWTLSGYGYCMGQFFHMKYVVLYGISTTLAKFENIPTPDTPKCIGRIHLYSDMWKYFDNGLYVFLLRYIYVPLKKYGISSYLAGFFSFCFVYIWHGLTTDIMIWAVLNYVCVNVESAFKNFYAKNVKTTTEEIMDHTWIQRIGCMLAAPLLAISAVSNFYFFGGAEIGNIYFKRLFTGGIQLWVSLWVCLYSCCQVSTYIRSREKRELFIQKLK